MMKLGKAPHPALVGGYDLLGEFADYDRFDPGAGGFEGARGVAGWSVLGTNTIVVSTDKAHSGAKSAKITYVDHAGGAQLAFSAANDLFTDLIIGKKYRVNSWAAVSAGGSFNVEIWNNLGASLAASPTTVTSETMIPVAVDFICDNATLDNLRLENLSAGEIAYLDDITIQELYTPDMSGRANHGTVRGATATPWGYSFNGSSDYIDLGSVSAFDSQDFTIIARINAEANGANNNIILNVGAFEIDFHVDVAGPIEISCADLTPNKITGSTILEDTGWYDVAVSKRGPNVSLYIDERLEADGSMAGTITFGNTQSYIGYDTTSYFKGTIGRVLFIPQALTQREILEEMRRFKSSLKLVA